MYGLTHAVMGEEGEAVPERYPKKNLRDEQRNIRRTAI